MAKCRSETNASSTSATFVPFTVSSKRFFKTDDDNPQGDEPEAAEQSEWVSVDDFSCRECSAECLTYKEIKEHLKVSHSGVRPAICKFCGQWFRNRQHFWRHVTSSLHDDLPDFSHKRFGLLRLIYWHLLHQQYKARY